MPMPPTTDTLNPTRPPSSASGSTAPSQQRTLRPHHGSSGIRTVVTAPPWARDEPPSPFDQEPLGHSREHLSEQPRTSDVASYQSSTDGTAGPSRWFAFTRHGPEESLTSHRHPPVKPTPSQEDEGSPNFRPQHRDRSLSVAWITASLNRRTQDEKVMSRRGKDIEAPQVTNSRLQDRSGFHLDLPAPEPVMTMAHNKTPGWDSPWSPRPPADLVARITNGANPSRLRSSENLTDSDNEKLLSKWARRRKRYRLYILTNPYVPLLFRFVNITFTTSALAVAIRIRMNEARHHITGAVGCSPTLVIIFAPLTLVHVMIAIYLEYFGRPLGLWRTSGKLAHTLSEVVFICAWSAALALSFDNFFTSVIPCASPSSTSWYNEVPRAPLANPTGDNIGKTICSQQLALICLVGVGLIMYCYNLVISLFRIFEKVKYHPGSTTVT